MRCMRLLVMFDLPTGTPEERRSYTRFRSFLLDAGFVQEQHSVYSRVAPGQAAVAALRAKIKLHTPAYGNVQVFQLTEKQYAGRDILVDSRPANRCDIGVQMTLEF